jgi:hypothetical protein
MQYITHDQIQFIKELSGWGGTITALWRVAVSTRKKLNQIMTDNVNRIRDDVVRHMDAKFVEHENSAFKRLDDQDERLRVLESRINEIVAVLKPGMKP